ncbi:hypothetical protein Cantr_01851 [Candida viswanathii]|uniref:BHLH domain-containing protein n=1 Tax=Candida viswanathii TaxID=5486 RepID=A0A367YMC2_9ASCO|nr:hypothetical protein Cantr_01851 [Candida viswanathii]
MSTTTTLQHPQRIMTATNNTNANNNAEQNEFDLLDIFSTDMDFEQAYNMYNNLQQKNALGSFEQLQKVQQLNQQYTSNLINTPAPSTSTANASSSQFPDQFAYERAHILNGPHNLHNNNTASSSHPPQGLVNNYLNKNYAFNDPTHHQHIDEEDDDDDFDQFFTNTESNALEKFLDSLANPISTGDPLQFYNNNNAAAGGHPIHNTSHEIDFNFEMHTMKVPQHLKPRSQSAENLIPIPLPPTQPPQQDHIQLKKELTEAFASPSAFNHLPSPNDSLNKMNNDPFLTNKKTKSPTTDTTTKKSKQLITPPTSGDELRKRNSDDDESDDELVKNEDGDVSKPMKKRRRSSNKPLLSIEQKRLNHSHSEQKRRQLCKLAYQRCLELIIDLDAFNKLPELNESERKSKRARVNKDGLPNLSKHNALIRISNEMILIKTMNENLRKFIENS